MIHYHLQQEGWYQTMLSKEPFIRNDSNYFVYSPSKNAMEMFLYPLQCGQFTYLPGYRLVREAFDSFLLMYIPCDFFPVNPHSLHSLLISFPKTSTISTACSLHF